MRWGLTLFIFCNTLLLFAQTGFAQSYSLTDETAGLDTWDTSNKIFFGGDLKTETSLPFTFTFFDKSYSSVWVTTNGELSFIDIGLAWDVAESTFRDNPMIAPYWADIVSTVYKNEYSDRVVFTWSGRHLGQSGTNIEVQAVLYKNGDIRIRYGTLVGEPSETPIVGISAGDNTKYHHNDYGNNAQTVYYKYVPAPPTPPAVVKQAPIFSDFVSSPSLIKRSQTAIFNLTITDSDEVRASSVLMEIRSPEGDRYGTAGRPVLVDGDEILGVYKANWTSPQDAVNGIYGVYAYACDSAGECPSNLVKVGNLTVNGTLIFDTFVPKPIYNQSETIVLEGILKDIQENRVETDVQMNISFESFETMVTNRTDRLGNFVISYRTSFADPVGDWSLVLSAEDEDGNSGEATFTVPVVEPAGVLFYNVVYLSPSPEAAYFRGETVRFSVKLLDVDQPVSNADVFLKLPTGERINMSEVSPGVGMYQTAYRIKFSDEIGDWDLVVEGTKETEEGLFAGARRVQINIRPVNLDIEVLSPTGNRFTVGQTTEIKVKVTYPDGSAASGIVVNATPIEESIVLVERDAGIYEGSYVFSEEEKGRYQLRIFATDAYNNLEFVEQSIFIVTPGLIDYLVQFWYLTAAAIGAAGYGVARWSWPKYSISRLENELKRLTEMKKDAQRKYFEEGRISKNTYEKLISEANQKEVEIKAKLKEIREKEKSKEKILLKLKNKGPEG